MNLVSIFSKSVSIAGIEVNDTAIRLVSFAKKSRASDEPEIRRLHEVPLAKGVIVGSTVQKGPELTKALKLLIEQSKFRGNYAIASIPIAETYSKIYTFPQTVSGEKLENAMRLNFEYQSPIGRDGGYADWETLETPDANESLFIVAPKSVSDGYIQAFQEAGIKLVALETHPQSLCRTLAVKPSDALLYTSVADTSASICVLQHGALRICRSMTGSIDRKQLQLEERKMRDAFETGTQRLKAAVILERAPIIKPFSLDPRIKKSPGTWAIALGAAMRGRLPRKTDTHISLLPVGTEEAYEFQRASVVAEFISTITVALGMFFGVVFLGSWFLMSQLQSTVNRQLATSLSLVPPTDAAELETKAREFNAIANTAASLIRTESRWNVVLTEIGKRTVPGVTISSMSLPAPEQNMVLNGLASSRAVLVSLRKSFEESELFTEVQLPLTNLDVRERIPFTLSFKLKDASVAYPQ